MGKSRMKRNVLTPPSRDQAEKILGDYAEIDARLHSITSKMDEKITRIRESFSDDLADLSEKREALLEKLQLYAETNRDLFEKKKHVAMSHGRIGFRTGTPKLTTKKGFTWSAATQLIKEFLPKYLIIKEAPDKKGLLADREVPEVREKFPKIGIGVVQDETFYVEIKKENEVLEQERKVKQLAVQ